MKFLHDRHASGGHNGRMPEGQCADCTILAGPLFETKSLDADGRCPSCADFFRRYGASPRAKLTPPNGTYLLGTDQLGRDMTSRIIHGSRVSLEVGLLAVLISTLIGAFIGMTSAYFGGVYDLLIQRVMDGIQAFPFLV